jgi:hypothetical protein
MEANRLAMPKQSKIKTGAVVDVTINKTNGQKKRFETGTLV